MIKYLPKLLATLFFALSSFCFVIRNESNKAKDMSRFAEQLSNDRFVRYINEGA